MHVLDLLNQVILKKLFAKGLIHHHLSPPFGRICWSLFPSIEESQIQRFTMHKVLAHLGLALFTKSSFEFSGILHVGPTKSLTFSRVFPKGCHSLFSLEGF